MVFSRAVTALAFAASSLAATTTVTNVAATTTSLSAPSSTATVLSGDISFSGVDQKIQNPKIPDHVNLTCKNCTTSGTLDLISGGYNNTDSDFEIAQDFFENGYLEFEARGVSANVSLDLQLLPGFSLANFKVPVFVKHLFTLPIGKLANVDVVFEIGIPVSITLNSEVDIFAGFLLTVPDGANIYLDIGNPNNSHVTGFNESKLTPLPFDVSAPGLSFTAITGMEMTMTANASATSVGNSSVSGEAVVTLDMPLLNTTVTSLDRVNATCDEPKGNEQTFDKAVNVLWSANVGLHLDGEIDAAIGNLEKSWAPPEISAFNRTFPLPTQCFKFDPAATGLVSPTGANSAAEASSSKKSGTDSLKLKSGSQSMMALLGILAVFLIVA